MLACGIGVYTVCTWIERRFRSQITVS